MFERKVPEKKYEATLEITPFSSVKMFIYSKPHNYRFMRLPHIINNEFKGVFDNLKSKLKKITRIHAPYPIAPNLIDESNECHYYNESTYELIDGIPILRGTKADADAVVLSESGDVHMFAPADCATLIIEFVEDDTIKYISAHIGLKSLIPFSGKNIVENICERLSPNTIKTAKGYIDFSISPSRLTRNINFPGQEDYNKMVRSKLQKVGTIRGDESEFEVDIKNLAINMFGSMGLTVVAGNNNTDNTDRFWSYRDNQIRNDRIDGRNLVVVVKE